MPSPLPSLTQSVRTLVTSTAFSSFLAGFSLMAVVMVVVLVSDNRMLHQEVASSQSNYRTLANAAPAAPAGANAKLVPPVTASDHIRGGSDAKVTLIEYSDYECPFCKQFHATVQQLSQEYGGKVRWVYRQLPLSIHAQAERESEASECVAALGGNESFWKFSDAVFSQTTSGGFGFPLNGLAPLAGQVGVDQAAFTKCLDAGTYAAKVKEQSADAGKAGINGTPGSLLIAKNGDSKIISGALPYASVKASIDNMLSAN